MRPPGDRVHVWVEATDPGHFFRGVIMLPRRMNELLFALVHLGSAPWEQGSGLGKASDKDDNGW